MYPPFSGFPPEGVAFFQRLKKNNNRPWFQKHKEQYEELVRFPMECLIASLGPLMAETAPDFEFQPRRSIFRIYRDVRFSKNKAPYKTNVAASFELRGKRGHTERPGLYLGIEPGEIFIGGGVYMPMGDQLKGIRKAITEQPEDFLGIIEDPLFKRMFKEILGERLQKAPQGYPKDHPMIEYLRFKQFFVGKVVNDTACFQGRFVTTVARVFNTALPFVRWLQSVS
jgi:uncharacterized protein (TIGR02453 family)